MQNQSTSSNSIFKMPPTPQPIEPAPPQNLQIESLLFNDIVEELSTAVREQLAQFLQHQPYRKFSIEFNNFMKRTTRLMQEGQQQGTNISRLTNSTQTLPINNRSSLSFNYKKPATVSMISYNNNTLKFPENNVQPAESINPFKPPTCANLQPFVSLSRIDQSTNSSQNTSTVLHTTRPSTIVTKESLPSNSNPPEPVATEKSKSSNNNSNSVKSLLENVGFEIIVGLPEKNDNTTKKNDTTQQIPLIENYLSKWSINLKEINTPMNTSKFVLLITGTLLSEDQTIIEKHHNAGILESRKDNNLVKTKNGIYRLVGNIIGGLPKELYQTCLSANGIPRNWRSILSKLCNANKNTKNTRLNIVLDSPAGPFKLMKNVNMNESMTRGGKTYGASNQYSIGPSVQNTNRKRKSSESDPSGSNSSKFSKFPPMLASTPKKPKKQSSIPETPSQILKKKLVQNILEKSKGKKLNTINDSINLIRERQSSEKKKAKAPVKTIGSTTKSKQSSVNNSEDLNSVNNTKQSTIRTSVNSSRTMNIMNSCKHKSSINSNKSSIEHSKLNRSEYKAKSQNLKDMLGGRVLRPYINRLQPVKNNYTTCSKNSSNKVEQVKKLKKSNSEKENPQCSSAALFGNVDVADFGDMSNFNLIPSLSPLSVTSRTDKSRSETPPLFYDRYVSSSKSLVCSEPPTPLSKLNECNALKRIKAPKITLEEEIKKNKKNHKKIDFKTASNEINRMLQDGLHSDEDDD